MYKFIVTFQTISNHEVGKVWSMACSAQNLYFTDKTKKEVVCVSINTGEFQWKYGLGSYDSNQLWPDYEYLGNRKWLTLAIHLGVNR